MKAFIGVDCGATNLRVGLVNEAGQLLGVQKIPSPLKNNSDQFAKVVKQQSQLLTANHPDVEISALGIATPGPLDLEQGILSISSNIGNSGPIYLKEQFAEEFDQPSFFDRDTNAALLGEVWQGAAVGKKNVVMLTLGSGVGGAILVNGQMDRGSHGRAGEIGHIFMTTPLETSEVSVPRCGLGHSGCLEALINSATTLDQLSTYLGYGLVTITNIFNPEMIVIGGGKIFMGDFLPKAVEVMNQQGIKGLVDGVEVVYAKLKDDSGVIGAAKLAIDNLK